MTIDISQGVNAYLQGGLGNQLFIYAAAYAQSKRLNCELFIDISRYTSRDPLERGHETQRTPEIIDLGLPGTVIDQNSPWRRNSPRRPILMRPLRSASHNLKVFREKKFGHDPRISQIVPGTTLYGYFQSEKYFAEVSDELFELICNISLNKDEINYVVYQKNIQTINAHVRRGDYLEQQNSTFHGLTSQKYFVNGLNVLKSMYSNAQFQIFTDSPEYVAQEFKSNKPLIAEDKGVRSIAAIIALSHCEGLVMSNSSFSWWAAWLLSKRDHTAKIIAPRPWQANGESAIDLLMPEWLSLDSR